MFTSIRFFASRLLGLLLVSTVFGASPAWTATFTVNSTADAIDASRGDGVCATADGVCTLRAAVQESNAMGGADTIVLPAGTYLITIPPSMRTDATGSLDVWDDLTVIGADPATTIIDGGALDNVLALAGMRKTVALSNLTIQNGSGSDSSTSATGGGILIQPDNSVTLTNVIVQNNHAAEGGGIYSRGNLTLVNSVVRGNTAVQAGQDSPPYLQGGGIYHAVGTLTIRESSIENNRALSAGGLFNAGVGVIERSTISGNVALNTALSEGNGGGGIVNGNDMDGSGELTLVNSTVSGNRANGHQGGIYNYNGVMTLSSVTISDNAADADGDGFGRGGGLGQGGGALTTMRNTLLAGNRAAGSAVDCFSPETGAMVSRGFNLIGNQGSAVNCLFTPVAGDQVGTAASPIDPQLQPLANNGGRTLTHALASTSLAVDAGDPTGCSDGTNALIVDQRGLPRSSVGSSGQPRCDIGAFELSRPVADAGADQRVQFDAVVTLDGSASSGLAGVASYAWTQVSGVPVALASAGSITASFTAPSVGGVLTFQLTLTDRSGATSSDTVNVVVNAPPVADAGIDQTVVAGASVNLNGMASTDGDGTVTTYSWIQTSGSIVTLANTDSATPSFTAPATGGTLTFALTVTDNDGATHSDNVTVTVNAPEQPSNNQSPVAKAGRDETAHPRAMVTLNGWGSYDPDGRIVSYRWTQTGGARVSLLGSSWPFAMFVAPRTEGTLTFQLTVTDDKGATSTDVVQVVVDDCRPRWYDGFSSWFGYKRHCR